VKIKEETEMIEGEVVEIEIDKPLQGSAAKTVSTFLIYTMYLVAVVLEVRALWPPGRGLRCCTGAKATSPNVYFNS
jgi:hypothetical protein